MSISEYFPQSEPQKNQVEFLTPIEEGAMPDLENCIRTQEFFDKKDWPPKEFIQNEKLKKQLLSKLPKTFPFANVDLNKMLRVASARRIKLN